MTVVDKWKLLNIGAERALIVNYLGGELRQSSWLSAAECQLHQPGESKRD